jgi:hypothetical protein
MFKNPSRDSRRQLLLANYQFVCNCKACKINLNPSNVPLPNPNQYQNFLSRKKIDNPKEFKDFVKGFKIKRYPAFDLCFVQEDNNEILVKMQQLFLINKPENSLY